MDNYLQRGEVVDLTPSAAVSADRGYRFGTGLFGVATNDADTTGPTPFVTEGVVTIAKTTASSITLGDRIDWDSSNSSAKKHDSAAANLVIGLALETRDSTTTTLKLKLCPAQASGATGVM